jgi:hypothetical protein
MVKVCLELRACLLKTEVVLEIDGSIQLLLRAFGFLSVDRSLNFARSLESMRTQRDY